MLDAPESSSDAVEVQMAGDGEAGASGKLRSFHLSDRARQQSGGKSSNQLRELLEIEQCTVVLDKIAAEGEFDPVSITCQPGEVVLLISPPTYSGKSSRSLFYLLAGQGFRKGLKRKAITGQALALTESGKINLVDTVSQVQKKRTSIYRKATPREVFEASLIMDGFGDQALRAQVKDAVRDAFEELLDIDEVVYNKSVHTGDREVDEGVQKGKDKCCQLRTQLSALDRRKLEFVCNFVKAKRPDLMFMEGLSDLTRSERCRYQLFLSRFAHASRRTTVFLKMEDFEGRTLEMCDKLVIMGKGRVMFAGSATAFRTYLEANIQRFGTTPWCLSAAQYFLECCDDSEQDAEVTDSAIIVTPEILKEAFTNSKENSEILNDVERCLVDAEVLVATEHSEKFNTGRRWRNVAAQVFVRENRNYVRTSGLTTLRMLLYFTFAVLTMIIASGTSVFEAANRIWLMIAFFDFTVAASLFGLFALRLERKTLFTEVVSGRVPLSAWMFGHFFGGALGVAWIAIPPGLASFYMFGFYKLMDTAGAAISYTLNYWLILVLCEQLWILVAFMIPQKKKATIVASFFALAFVLGQSIFTKLADLPANRYVMFITLFRPAMNTFFSNIFAGDDPRYFLPQKWTSGDDCWVNPQDSNKTLWSTDEVLDCMETRVWSKCEVEPKYGTRWTGDEALKCLGYPSKHAWENALISVAITFLFRFLIYIGVRWEVGKIKGVKELGCC